MKTKFNLALIAFFISIITGFSQDKKPFVLQQKDDKGDIVMTWNKNTPEQEMKDDIKALGEHGVTISYSDVKRNSKGEITAIKVTYSDRKGNKGAMELDNLKPINTIRIYKQGDEIGFGEPDNNDFIAGNGMPNFQNGKNPMPFQFNNNDGSLGNGNSYSYSFSDDNSSAKSRSIIQKDGKKPLVLEDGEVVQGGDDYTKEELEAIKKENAQSDSEKEGFSNFNFGNNSNLSEQMKKMQEQIDQMMQQQNQLFGNSSKPLTPSKPSKPKSDLDDTKEEMLKAKEDMQNAKKEMEEAKKELEKAKSTLKTQKA